MRELREYIPELARISRRQRVYFGVTPLPAAPATRSCQFSGTAASYGVMLSQAATFQGNSRDLAPAADGSTPEFQIWPVSDPVSDLTTELERRGRQGYGASSQPSRGCRSRRTLSAFGSDLQHHRARCRGFCHLRPLP
jgi:hypothetical protein